MRISRIFNFAAILCLLAARSLLASDTFTVASYNVENYLLEKSGTRPGKSDEARAKIRENLVALNADVLALQEMGSTNALMELRSALKAQGLEYPHWEHITAFDTNIHVAVLSKLPITARRPHTKDGYLLFGKRLQISRGFIELDIQVNPRYSFTLINAHLKSKRPVSVADEADMREQEAVLLREKVDARLAANANANIIVLGDFNDTHDSKPIKTIIGRGNKALIDTRPAERNGDNLPNPNPAYKPRTITWTHHYGVEDTYSRIDYIMVSRGMAREWQTNGTYILTVPNWGLASDHRPIIATFSARDQ